MTLQKAEGAQWHYVCFSVWQHERPVAEKSSPAAAAAANNCDRDR